MVTRITNKCQIFGEEGYIKIPDFWKANNCKLFDKNFNQLEVFDDGRISHGFIYQMQHANSMIMFGNIESSIMPHSRSNDIQETMMEIRKQIGLKYPFE